MLVPLLVIILLSTSSSSIHPSSLFLLTVSPPPGHGCSPCHYYFPLPPPTVSPILVVMTSLGVIMSSSFPCSLGCFHLLCPLTPHLLSHQFAPGVINLSSSSTSFVCVCPPFILVVYIFPSLHHPHCHHGHCCCCHRHHCCCCCHCCYRQQCCCYSLNPCHSCQTHSGCSWTFLAIVKLVCMCPSLNPLSFVETGCWGSRHSVSASFSPDGGG